MLEVVDDIIAENDEIFIIYTSIVEDPDDPCARAVLLHDDDGEKTLHTHTCSESVIIYNYN